MTTIYVVTSGLYDDYGIERLFSTYELAEAFIRRDENPLRFASTPTIEEWELDKDNVEE
jgi:hypothetical protein